MRGYFNKRNKIVWFGFLVALLAVIDCSIVFFQKETKPYKAVEAQPMYAFDSSDLSNVIRDADYVFAGRLSEVVSTEYKHKVQVNGKETGMPYTNLVVEVIKNVKGDLQTGKEIRIQKAGGLSEDKKEYSLYENDIIPEEGKYYIFSAYVQEDGSLLVAGENSTIETNAQCSTDTYREMEEAKKKAKEKGETSRKRYLLDTKKIECNPVATGNPNIPDARSQSAEWNINPDEEKTAKSQPEEVGDSVLAALSSDGKYEVYTKSGDDRNVYLYDKQTENIEKIKVENDLDLETMIMSLKWINKKEFAVISHVNPSLSCLSVYNAKTKEKKMEKFGSLFKWKDEDYNSLIYVLPAPHFAEYSGKEKVMNANDEVLYQTAKNELVKKLSVNETTGELVLVLTNINEKDEQKVILPGKSGDK